jgi:hypothetical protein
VNDQREAAVQRLSEHFAADQISMDELERRLDLVYQAQSPGELATLTADLPTVTPPMAAGRLSIASSHQRLRGPVVRRIRTFLGNIERSGPMDVPPMLEVRSTLGNIELDLSDATFGPLTEIAIHSVLGNVEITLPAGVRVENDGSGLLGSFECHVLPGAMPMVGTAPVVRLTGRTILGNVEVHADATPTIAPNSHAALHR